MPGLGALIGRRLVYGLLTLLVVSIIIFFATELLPGDIARAMLDRRNT